MKKNKSLPLDIVFKVMLDINLTGNWEKAMTHVPERYWADVKTPKLRQYWQEKFEKKRLAFERYNQERDDRELEEGNMDYYRLLHRQ